MVVVVVVPERAKCVYADDTVIFASSARDLQISLNNLSTYSKLWKLKVNIEKTKNNGFQ